jgi:hypothetical protein
MANYVASLLASISRKSIRILNSVFRILTSLYLHRIRVPYGTLILDDEIFEEECHVDVNKADNQIDQNEHQHQNQHQHQQNKRHKTNGYAMNMTKSGSHSPIRRKPDSPQLADSDDYSSINVEIVGPSHDQDTRKLCTFYDPVFKLQVYKYRQTYFTRLC